MPKVSNTRRQRAIKLLRMIEEHDPIPSHIHLTPDDARAIRESYRRWQISWVRHEIINLVRELAPLEKATQGREFAFASVDEILAAARAHQKEERRVPKHD